VKWRSQIITFLIVFLLIGLLFSMPGGCKPPRQQTAARPAAARVIDLTTEGMPPAAAAGRVSPYSFVIHAEVAETKEQRQRGLSGRPAVEPGYGMLYVYDRPERPEFSEALTPFPLSVAFMKADGTIAEIRNAEANDPTPFLPRVPISYALEVRSGWFQDRDIAAGARFKIPAGLKERAVAPAESPLAIPVETPAAVPAETPVK
jgi:hypothetical protein